MGIVSYSTWSIKDASEVKGEVRAHEFTPMQGVHQVTSTDLVNSAAEKYVIKRSPYEWWAF
jgi:hypothetical protein